MLVAADLLREADIDVTDVGERVGVDPGTIPIAMAPWWLRAVWARGTSAMTMPWVIWVAPEVMAWKPRRRALLIAHELAHSGQWQRLGAFSFLTKYLSEYARARIEGNGHREAYRSLTFEREAEQVREELAAG